MCIRDRLWNEKAMLDHQWIEKEIKNKEYVVRDEDIKRRIRELEG